MTAIQQQAIQLIQKLPDDKIMEIITVASDDINLSESNTLNTIPRSEYLKYFSPLIQALRALGGSAECKKAYEKVIEIMGISEEELLVTNTKTGGSKVLSLIAFARNSLADEGFISRETKGIWSLTEMGMKIDMTMELVHRIYSKRKKINNEKNKGLPISEIDISKYYKFLKYTKEQFLTDVFITKKDYDKLRTLLLSKKNIILQGAPGVGKTFSAKRLAYSIMGEMDDFRIEFVQFHQSYSYEDFIMGYRPNETGGFKLQEGIFYRFCQKARQDPRRDYFFIIDEINRGNLSKIFGELLMLIEKDYRTEKATLAYTGERFSVPENIYIIGMMNTADRSLAMIDYALRRRFSFFEMKPGFTSVGFKAYSDKLNNETFNALIEQIKLLNNDIEKDNCLGKGFSIGHSYFCNLKNDEFIFDRLCSIVDYDIIPILNEYWFDDEKKTINWKNRLYQTLGVSNDE